MKRLIEFETESGSTIRAEVDDPTLEVGIVDASPSDLLQKSKLKFEEAIRTIKPVAENLIETLSDVKNPPDQITAELAFKFNASGVLIASLSAEANCKVILTWSRAKN